MLRNQNKRARKRKYACDGKKIKGDRLAHLKFMRTQEQSSTMQPTLSRNAPMLTHHGYDKSRSKKIASNDLVRMVAIGRVIKKLELFQGCYQVEFGGRIFNLPGDMIEKIQQKTTGDKNVSDDKC